MTLHEIEIQYLEKLGSGKNGTAYNLDGYVLKVTENPYEYQAALRLIECPQDWSCEIIAAEQVGDEYFILKEMVDIQEYDPTDENGEFYGVEHEDFGNVIHTPWDFCRSWEKKGKTFADLSKSDINKIAQKQRTKIGQKLYKWFVAKFQDVEEFGIDTRDLYQNIGVNKNGDFCFFDVMQSKTF